MSREAILTTWCLALFAVSHSLLFSGQPQKLDKKALTETVQKIVAFVDPENSGKMSIEMVRSILRRINFPEDKLEKFLLRIDPNKDGFLHFKNFGIDLDLGLNLNLGEIVKLSRKLDHKKKVDHYFNFLDSAGKGYVTIDFVRAFLPMGVKPTLTKEEIEEFVGIVDPDKDGKVYYNKDEL